MAKVPVELFRPNGYPSWLSCGRTFWTFPWWTSFCPTKKRSSYIILSFYTSGIKNCWIGTSVDKHTHSNWRPARRATASRSVFVRTTPFFVLFCLFVFGQAVGGAVAMLWNAATVLPLPGSDGKTAISTLFNDLPVAGFANFLAVVFVVRNGRRGGGFMRPTCWGEGGHF